MAQPKEEFKIKTLSALEKVFPTKAPKILENSVVCFFDFSCFLC